MKAIINWRKTLMYFLEISNLTHKVLNTCVYKIYICILNVYVYIKHCWKSSLNIRHKSLTLQMKKLRHKDIGYLILCDRIHSGIYRISITPLLKGIILVGAISQHVLAYSHGGSYTVCTESCDSREVSQRSQGRRKEEDGCSG